MRNMMVTVVVEDYVTVAQAKGLSERARDVGYAARNAMLPQVSGFALSLGFIVGGTLVMEIVFSYPGIGYFLFTAVGAKDYPLMQGIFLVITLAVLVANIVADFVYVVLDPRTRRRADDDDRHQHRRGERGARPAVAGAGHRRDAVRARRRRADRASSSSCATRKAITGLVILGFFLLIADHRPVDRAVRPERAQRRHPAAAVVGALVRHHPPRPGHLLARSSSAPAASSSSASSPASSRRRSA